MRKTLFQMLILTVTSSLQAEEFTISLNISAEDQDIFQISLQVPEGTVSKVNGYTLKDKDFSNGHAYTTATNESSLEIEIHNVQSSAFIPVIEVETPKGNLSEGTKAKTEINEVDIFGNPLPTILHVSTEMYNSDPNETPTAETTLNHNFPPWSYVKPLRINPFRYRPKIDLEATLNKQLHRLKKPVVGNIFQSTKFFQRQKGDTVDDKDNTGVPGLGETEDKRKDGDSSKNGNKRLNDNDYIRKLTDSDIENDLLEYYKAFPISESKQESDSEESKYFYPDSAAVFDKNPDTEFSPTRNKVEGTKDDGNYKAEVMFPLQEVIVQTKNNNGGTRPPFPMSEKDGNQDWNTELLSLESAEKGSKNDGNKHCDTELSPLEEEEMEKPNKNDKGETKPPLPESSKDPKDRLRKNFEYKDKTEITEPSTQEILFEFCNNKVCHQQESLNFAIDHLGSTYTKIKALHGNVQYLPYAALSHLPNLNHVELESVELQALVPGSFQNLPKLKYLSLYDNKLIVVPFGVFNNLPIQTLHLENNLISLIGNSAFAFMKELKYLYLSNNRLKVFDPAWFINTPNLVVLNLDHNEIELLPVNAFRHMKMSEETEISFEHNYIDFLELDMFSTAEKSINLISFKDNHLKCVEGVLEKSFPAKTVNLVGNPLTCECKTKISKSGSIVEYDSTNDC